MFWYNYVINSQVEHKHAQPDPIQVNQNSVLKQAKKREEGREREQEWNLI